MSEEEQDISPEYLKAFNNGYIIGKHDEELAKVLVKVQDSNPILQGLRDGIKAFTMERLKVFEPPKDPTQNPSSPDKEKDIEPEM